MQQDPESTALFDLIGEQEKIRATKVAGVRTILVVISAAGMVFDVESLRQKILLTYPDAAIFFATTLGLPLGPSSPRKVDLVVDFTGPGQRQKLFLSRKLRRMGRIVAGRNAGLFRKRIYDRVFDEKTKSASVPSDIPVEQLQRERFVQRKVLESVGVAFVQAGTTPADRGKSIALELPPMQRL